MIELKCQLSDETGSAPSDSISGLTVGKVFQLSCEGDLSGFDPAALAVFVQHPEAAAGNSAQPGTQVPGVQKPAPPNKPDIYSLKLLSTLEFQPTHAKWSVTSYQVGRQPQGTLYLTDGKNQALLRGPEWTVNSVIEVKEGEPPQPFGPIGPLQVELGTLFWVILVAAVMLWIANSFWSLRERRRTKALFESLKSFRTHRSALDEFYTELRAMDRKYNFAHPSSREVMTDLLKSFRMYLVRELSIPAHVWSARRVIQEIKRRKMTPSPQLMGDLKKCWGELELATKEKSSFDFKTLQQTVVLTRSTVEKIGEWVRDPEGDRT